MTNIKVLKNNEGNLLVAAINNISVVEITEGEVTVMSTMNDGRTAEYYNGWEACWNYIKSRIAE